MKMLAFISQILPIRAVSSRCSSTEPESEKEIRKSLKSFALAEKEQGQGPR